VILHHRLRQLLQFLRRRGPVQRHSILSPAEERELQDRAGSFAANAGDPTAAPLVANIVRAGMEAAVQRRLKHFPDLGDEGQR